MTERDAGVLDSAASWPRGEGHSECGGRGGRSPDAYGGGTFQAEE